MAGTRTPVDLAHPNPELVVLRTSLTSYGKSLEREYSDALDIEFTVETGKLYLLQVRPAKRTAAAAVRIATEMLAEGAIDEETGGRPRSPSGARCAAWSRPSSPPRRCPGRGCSPPASVPRRAMAAAPRCSTPTGPRRWRPRASTSCSCGRPPARRTCGACSRPPRWSPPAAARPAMPRWSPAHWTSPAWSVRRRSTCGPRRRSSPSTASSTPKAPNCPSTVAPGRVYAGILPRSVPDSTGGGLEHLLSVADRRSGAGVWLPAAAAGRGGAGIGPIGLTDLLSPHPGAIGRTVAAIEALNYDPNAPAARSRTCSSRTSRRSCARCWRTAAGCRSTCACRCSPRRGRAG